MESKLHAGSSVALDGVCLSLERITDNIGHFIAVEETISRTTIKMRKTGNKMNIELPATPDAFLDGHIVQGHVDCTGKLESLVPKGAQHTMKISYPVDFSKYVVEKGSISIDGISLTVTRCGKGWFQCAIIPDTMTRTTLQFKSSGENVNLEFDILAKYMESLLGKSQIEETEDDLVAIY